MKNLNEVWSLIGQEQKEIENNYYAILTNIGIHGRSKFVIFIDDIDKEFKSDKNIKNLFMSENKDIRVLSDIIIRTDKRETVITDEGKAFRYEIWHRFNILHNQGEEYFYCRMKKLSGVFIDPENLSREEYDKECLRKFNPETIKSWKDIIDLFV